MLQVFQSYAYPHCVIFLVLLKEHAVVTESESVTCHPRSCRLPALCCKLGNFDPCTKIHLKPWKFISNGRSPTPVSTAFPILFQSPVFWWGVKCIPRARCAYRRVWYLVVVHSKRFLANRWLWSCKSCIKKDVERGNIQNCSSKLQLTINCYLVLIADESFKSQTSSSVLKANRKHSFKPPSLTRPWFGSHIVLSSYLSLIRPRPWHATEHNRTTSQNWV